MGSDAWREERVRVRGAQLAVQRRGTRAGFLLGPRAHVELRAGRPGGTAHLGSAARGLGGDPRGCPGTRRIERRGPTPMPIAGPSSPPILLALAGCARPRSLRGRRRVDGRRHALHAAVAAPGRVDALVLMIPPTAWATRAAQASRYRASADLAEREGLAALAAAEALQPPIPIFRGLFDPAEMARARYAAQDVSVLAGDPARRRGLGLPRPGRGRAPAPADAAARVGGRRRPSAQHAPSGSPSCCPNATLSVARRLQDLGAWPRLVAEFCARHCV